MKVLVKGQLVEYSDKGNGRVIVLLHGWGSSLKSFTDLSKHLESNYRVVSLDFPGFGGSPQPLQDWGVGEYSDFVHDFLEKLKINKPYVLAGHSFGGRVIIKGIHAGALSSEKVVLIDSAGVRPSDNARKLIFKFIAKSGKAITSLPVLKLLRPALRNKLYATAGSTDYLDSGTMKNIFVKTIDEDLLPFVSSIKQPTLLIWGEKDQITPLSEAESLLGQLADARISIIPGAGHYSYVDNSPAFIKAMDEFII